MLALLAAGAAALRWHRLRQHDPWLCLLGQARQRLIALDVADAAWLGPRQLAAALHTRWGSSSQSAQDWLLAMEQWRYAPDRQPRPSLSHLRRSLRAVRWPPLPPKT